jgi:hypothetical protein
MALDAKALAKVKANHARERADLVDKHGAERRQLSELAKQRRQRDIEEGRKAHHNPVRMAGQHSSIRLDNADVDIKRRVDEHAALKERHDKEYRSMTARHKREIEEAEKGNLPAHHRVPGAAQLGKVWGARSPQDERDYRAIVAKHENDHNTQHNIDESRKDRLSRYRSSSMQSKLEEDRLAKHTELNKRHEAELSSLRRRIERRQGRSVA